MRGVQVHVRVHVHVRAHHLPFLPLSRSSLGRSLLAKRQARAYSSKLMTSPRVSLPPRASPSSSDVGAEDPEELRLGEESEALSVAPDLSQSSGKV